MATKLNPTRPVARRRARKFHVESLEARQLLTTLPAGFTETLITTGDNLSAPTAMEFSPTGQLWVLQQGGVVKVVNFATGGTSVAGSLTVNSSGERGLLGIAFDPSYDGAGPNADNVFLYYTATTPNVHNRLSRFAVNNAGSATSTLGAETIIMEVAPEPQGDGSSNHNGGAIHFGLDGNLYVAIGDHNADGSSFRGANHVSQRLEFQHGKILRIDVSGDDFPADPNRNYAIPADNPFIDANPATFDETWTLGLRNPYTFAVQPGTGRIFINDVGEGQWEEINDGIAGTNYGWASEGTPGGFAEGFESAAPSYVGIGSYQNPEMAFDHSNSAPSPFGCGITGGAFYPSGSQFGSAYADRYFFADFCGSFIRVFDPANPGSIGTPDTSATFASSLTTGSPVDLKVDAAGNLYYLSRGGPGEIYRISFNAPSITDQPDDVTVTAGQPATFAIVAAGGQPLSYQWQRADSATPANFVDIPGATNDSFTLASTQTGDNGDRFRVVVTNSAGAATSNSSTLTVNVAGQAPTITTQPSDELVNAGQSAMFNVVAIGSVPLSYQWQRADSVTPANFSNIAGATSTSFTLASAQAADSGDRFRVVVTNAFGSATSSAATLSVNQFPTASITADATYTFGDTINFSANATDAEDGPLPPSAYTWTVDFAHDAHFHPHVAPFSGVTGSSFVAGFVEPDADQFYRIRLTVTDSNGAASSTFFDVQPIKVDLTLGSNPAGVPLTIDGQPVSGPQQSVVGTARTIQAPPSHTVGTTAFIFDSWSDGGAATHTITTPAADTTYTATFQEVTVPAIIDNGDVGYSSPAFTRFGPPTNLAQGYQDDVHFHAASSGSNTAVWTFTGLTPGIYQVAATWTPHANRANNSPFTVGGGASGGAVAINQRLAPSSFAGAIADQGVFWTPLNLGGNGGEYVVTGSTLTVTLGTATTGYVIADAVRIERLAGAPSEPEVEVFDGGANLASGATLGFGTLAQGTPVPPRTIRIENAGNSALALGELGIGGDAAFSLDTAGLDAVLDPGESTTFRVLVNTSSAGTFNAAVTIPSLAPNDDADENPFIFNVTATISNSIIIDNGDAGFSAPAFTRFGPPTNPAQGYQDDVHFHAASSSSNTAVWTFAGLTPGIYQVAATWTPHANRANNSPFTVGGGASGGAVAINQRLAPSSFAGAFADQGVFWTPLNLGGNGGEYVVTGSTLTVTLGTATTGYVIADAVRIERLAGAPSEPEIDVFDGGANLASGATVEFGSHDVASPAPTRTITVLNSGTAPLDLGAIQLSGDAALSLDTSGLDAVLDPNESTTFDVLLDTSSPSNFTATVSIPSLAPNDDADENPFTMVVTAIVVDTSAAPLIIDNGDTGFTAPTFTRFGPPNNPAQGYQQDVHYHAASGGSHTATWTFNGLTPGVYQVAVTWTAHANRANNSPFTVGGVAGGGMLPINQRLSPSSFASVFSDQGVFWVPLPVGGNGGNFQLNGSTLAVTLGTSTTGYVIADAVRIEQLPALLAAESVGNGQSPVAGDEPTLGGGGGLSNAAISDAIAAGTAEWARVNPSAAVRLSKVTVQIADLPSNVLGLASQSSGRISLDTNAAGYGWDVSRGSRVESRGIDLLTVVAHELGHVLGLPDLDPSLHPRDVMADRLSAGLVQRDFRAHSQPMFDAATPWLGSGRTQAADRLFDRWDTPVESEVAEDRGLRLNRSVAEASIAWRLADDYDRQAFDRHTDDREDETTADAVFEDLLADLD